MIKKELLDEKELLENGIRSWLKTFKIKDNIVYGVCSQRTINYIKMKLNAVVGELKLDDVEVKYDELIVDGVHIRLVTG